MGKTHFDVLSLFSFNWVTRLLVCSCSVCSELFNSCNRVTSQVYLYRTLIHMATEKLLRETWNDIYHDVKK